MGEFAQIIWNGSKLAYICRSRVMIRFVMILKIMGSLERCTRMQMVVLCAVYD